MQSLGIRRRVIFLGGGMRSEAFCTQGDEDEVVLFSFGKEDVITARS